MTVISTRASVLAVKPESTEGTPVAPTGAGDFTALQDDFDMTPAFDQLENAELKASIGTSKSIVGPENPTVSFSHYLRHSGVEGTAPDYNEILKAGFGAEAVNGTEYLTTTGSTTAVIESTGASTNFVRGEGLLIKDGTNGYSIRAVDSVSGTSITLPFQVAAAPASGIGLGKAVLYSPTSTGHQSLSLWHYLGNGGATQLMSGAKVTEIGISASVGELLNATFSFEGLSYYYNPITIGATDRYLDFTDDDGTFAAIVAAKTYKDPYELAQALQDAMRTASPGETATVTYYSVGANAGKFNIKTTGTVLSLLWNTGTNTANTIGDKIGFSVAADDTGTGATTGYTSDNAQTYAAPYTPTFDAADPIAVKYHEVLLGDSADDTTCIQVSSVEFTLSNTNSRIPDLCAESGFSGSIFNQREVTVTVSALVQKYEAEKFKNFRASDNVKFMYNFGTKAGGNWVPGKCGNVFLPSAVISSFDVGDADGLVSLELEVKAYVDNDGNGECYLNFL
jgi:hypothetical protein